MTRNYRISRVMVPATSTALITLDEAKTALGISLADTSQDAAITQQIDQVSAAINNYCDRIFVRQTYEDHFRYVCQWVAPGKPIRTRQYPIPTDLDGVPLLTVTEDGAAIDPTMWEIDIETGWLYRLNGSNAVASWSGNSIIVDYDGGYDTIPADLQGAALDWLKIRRAGAGRDPLLRSETIPDIISQTWATAVDLASAATSIPSSVRDWLSGYRYWTV
jgi:hypothetical protein